VRLKRKSIVAVYTRHKAKCPHKKNEAFARCECPKYLRWSQDGSQHREPAKTRAWGIAEQKAAELQKRLDSGGAAPQPTVSATPTIAAWAETFITNKQNKGVGPATERKIRHHLGTFEQFMSARSKFFPQDVTVADVVEYRASWSSWKSGVTRAKAQQNIRSFVRFMGRVDLLPVLDTIIKSEEDNARLSPKPFTEAELKRLLAKVPVTFPDAVKAARVTALIHCMVSTGLAIRDTVQLEKGQIRDGWLKIKRQKMKKKEGGKVQQKLDPALHQELLAVTNGNPRFVFWSGEGTPVSTVTNWQNDLRILMKAAGVYIPGNLSHRFRDTAVDFWLGAGCSMTEVAAMLGDTVATTEHHYADLASGRMKERLSKIPGRTW
jgi:site-specific recombinase XerD